MGEGGFSRKGAKLPLETRRHLEKLHSVRAIIRWMLGETSPKTEQEKHISAIQPSSDAWLALSDQQKNDFVQSVIQNFTDPAPKAAFSQMIKRTVIHTDLLAQAHEDDLQMRSNVLADDYATHMANGGRSDNFIPSPELLSGLSETDAKRVKKAILILQNKQTQV